MRGGPSGARVSRLLWAFGLFSELLQGCQAFGGCHAAIMGMSMHHEAGDVCPPAAPVPRAVVFDIDGTLCNSFTLGYSATNTVLKRHGYQETSTDEYHQGTRFSTPDRLARHVGLCPERDGENFAEMGSKMGKEFDDLYIGLVDTSTAPLFDGIQELISDCARVTQVGALSNAAVAYVHKVLDVHSLRASFSVLHGADDVPAPKPSPDGLLECCKDLQLQDPSTVVYVGDSPSDGLAARAAGMRSVGVTWGSHSKETLHPAFDTVVDNVQELRTVLLEKGVRSPRTHAEAA
mmetsp:Transcript_3062/g.7644  ORF Transcript_3062/g.7644 Transcript_3062/m.7644 type:complete len:291 (+) Transcript_3062:127-999(+)